jgi:hypothetical protein
MGTLDSELASVLRRIAQADAASGGHVRFIPFFASQADGPIRVDPAIDGHEDLRAGAIVALCDLGYLDVAPPSSDSSEYGPFQLTAAGREANARFREAAPAAQSAPQDTSWDSLRPILVAAVQEWERHGARGPVPTEVVAAALRGDVEESRVQVALDLLEQGGWLTAEFEAGTDWPIEVSPTPKALQDVRGWPGQPGDAAIVRALLAALDDAIERASDPDEKTRLQALRDAAGDVGKSVLAGAILSAGKLALGA